MPEKKRRSLLVERVHTMRSDGRPRCGWDNVPDPAYPHRYVDLPYCGTCLLIDLHQERLDPDHDALPWTLVEPDGCRPPDQLPWEAHALLDPERWTFTLADLAPWVVDERRWWFGDADPGA